MRGKAELLTSNDPAEAPYEILNVLDDTLNTGSGKSQQKALRKWGQDHGHYLGIKLRNIPASGLSDPVIDPIACADVDPIIRALWGRLTSRPSGWTRGEYENENNHSVVVRVDFGTASFLFPGDIEDVAELKLLDKYSGTDLLDVDVYQAAHHGSATSSLEAFLIAVSPQIIVIPMGDPARTGSFTARAHGHPRQVCVDRLVAHTSNTRTAVQVPVGLGQDNFQVVTMTKAIYATGWDGDIRIVADSDGTLTPFVD